MTNPFGGRWNTLTSSEYHTMDKDYRKKYHYAMFSFYNRQIKKAVTPRKAGQAPPATDDQIRGLRELARFHSRQGIRMERESTKETYYSLEDEQNRFMIRPRYDAVERIPHTTKEMYDKYSREDKLRYWGRLAPRLTREYGNKHPKAIMAARIKHRMESNPNYNPAFEGDESTTLEYKDKYRPCDISEYNNFTDKEKRKYHYRCMRRQEKKGNKEAYLFHRRMVRRINNNSRLLTYSTPEAEKEAEEE
tara:strand:- start:8872 stop:9615 length:744 start_codon:yes stop_codon:yes gene_type:complete